MSSSYFRTVHHTVNCAHTREYIAATANGDIDRPKLSVAQYIPLDNPNPQPGDVTIIGAHACGFPKELYEPLWDEIYQRSAKNNIRIRSIWIADLWNQGQSGVLNEGILGGDPSWSDHARDLLNLINQKQDEIVHPIVGVGHSFGGTQLTILSLMHPRLLTSLILLDPVIQLPNPGIGPAISSTHRRDIWPSRAFAASKFHVNKFYQAWDPRVLSLWITHGLRDLPTELHPSDPSNSKSEDVAGEPPVTLTTSKHQELLTFLRPTFRPRSLAETYADKDPLLDAENPGYPFYRAEPLQVFRRLPEVRPSVLYIFGGESELSTPALRAQKMELTGSGVGGSGGKAKGRVKEVVLEGVGHLVAMERVRECAEAIGGWLGGEMGRWRGEQEDFRKKWVEGTGRREKITVGERWKDEIKPKKEKAKI